MAGNQAGKPDVDSWLKESFDFSVKNYSLVTGLRDIKLLPGSLLLGSWLSKCWKMLCKLLGWGVLGCVGVLGVCGGVGVAARNSYQQSYPDVNPANYNLLGHGGTNILRVTESCKIGLTAHSVVGN